MARRRGEAPPPPKPPKPPDPGSYTLSLPVTVDEYGSTYIGSGYVLGFGLIHALSPVFLPPGWKPEPHVVEVKVPVEIQVPVEVEKIVERIVEVEVPIPGPPPEPIVIVRDDRKPSIIWRREGKTNIVRVKETTYGAIEVVELNKAWRVHIVPLGLLDRTAVLTAQRHFHYRGASSATFGRALTAAFDWDGSPESEPQGYDRVTGREGGPPRNAGYRKRPR